MKRLQPKSACAGKGHRSYALKTSSYSFCDQDESCYFFEPQWMIVRIERGNVKKAFSTVPDIQQLLHKYFQICLDHTKIYFLQLG